MLHRRVALMTAIFVLLAACEQQPVGLPVTDDTPWRTLVSIPIIVDAGVVWGSSPKDVYLVHRTSTDEVTLRHFDGVSWQPVNFPMTTPTDIWGTGPSNVYVATYPDLLHYDGAGWSTTGQRATRVTGTAADDVYATDFGRVVHFDGTEWSEILSGRYVNAIWAGEGSRALVVREITYSTQEVRWWDGVDWNEGEAPGWIHDLWGDSADHVVAAGYDNSAGKGMVWTWNGTEWTPDALPAVPVRLHAIDGSGRDDLYAVGSNGTVLHFDGVMWETADFPTQERVDNVWARDPRVVYVTGSGGTVFQRTPASEWTRVFDYPVQGEGPLWAASKREIVIGGGGVIHRREDGVWSRVSITEYDVLRAMDGRAPDDVYAALSYWGVYHYDGLSWTSVLDSASYVQDIHALTNGHVCVLDGYEGLFVFDGTQWSNVARDEGRDVAPNSMWASAINDVWLPAGRTVRRYDGTGVRNVLTSEREWYEAVWGRDRDDVYIAGSEGILHYDGGSFTRVGPQGPFFNITGSGSRVVASRRDMHACLEHGYWRLSQRSPRDVYQLVTALDGTIMSLSFSSDRRTTFIAYLP